MNKETEKDILNHLMSNLTKKDLEQEVGRFVTRADVFQDPNSIQIWVIKQNMRQITEKTVELEIFPNNSINLTLVAPNFFTDVFEGQVPVIPALFV